MILTEETGRRGGRYHTRFWDLGDSWEMCARKCGSWYEWTVYRWDEERINSPIHSPTFYTKRDAINFYKAAA